MVNIVLKACDEAKVPEGIARMLQIKLKVIVSFKFLHYLKHGICSKVP
jgi:hypothetical protein